jgi:hypothetical protein
VTRLVSRVIGAEFGELIISSSVLTRNEEHIPKLQAVAGILIPIAPTNPMGKCCHGDDPKFTRVQTEWSHSLRVHL